MFFEDCCEFSPEHWTAFSPLWAAYERYAAQRGDKLANQRMFLDRLLQNKCENTKTRPIPGQAQQRGWKGVRLIDAETQEEEEDDPWGTHTETAQERQWRE